MVKFENERAKVPTFEGRKCRDILWLIIFVLFVIGMLVVTFVGISEGNYKRVTNGMDYRGCICGTKMSVDADNQCVDNSTAPELGSKTVFVEWLDTSTWGTNLYVMCAPSCPSTTVAILCRDASAANGVLEGTGNSLTDQYQSIIDSATGQANGCSSSSCSWIVDNCAITYKAKSTFGYCLPTDNTTFVDFANDFIGDEGWTTAVNSIEKGAWIIFACVIASCIFAFIYMKLLERMAKCLTFTALVLIFVGILLSGIFLLSAANNIKDSYSGQNADGYKDDLQWQMSFYGAIAVFILAFLYFVVVACMCKKILLAIKCVEVASDAIGDVPTIVVIPFILGFIGLVIFVLWCITAVLLYSAGDVVAADPPTNLVPNGLYKKFEFSRELQYMGLYHLFGLFWTTQFVGAFGELAMAYVVVRWFFSPRENGQRKVQASPVKSAFGMVFTKHLGSLAFGSLIVAVVKFMRAILEYISRKTANAQKENKCIKFTFCCCRCCLWCLEKCMKFVNNQAYIQIALTGDSFCTAAKRAFWLILRNIGEIGAIKLTSTLFVFLGKLVITSMSTALCYAILTQVPTFKDQTKDTAVPNAFIPAGLTALITFFIAHMFMSVYSQTIETVLMCFIHDKEATGGANTDNKVSATVQNMKEEDASNSTLSGGTSTATNLA